jgi:hypothetical protein
MSFPGSILDFIANNLLSLAGGIWAAVGFLVTWLAKQYLVPLLRVERNRRYARWIAAIADELTDDLKARYPGNKWISELDEAIDRIMEICGIEKAIAGRAIRAAVARKG